jgi:hypothetical protein
MFFTNAHDLPSVQVNLTGHTVPTVEILWTVLLTHVYIVWWLAGPSCVSRQWIGNPCWQS